MKKETLVFKNYAEMRKFYRGGGVFVEPERVGEVSAHEVPPERPREDETERDAVSE